MVTPFNSDLKIDWEQTGKLVDYLIEEQLTDGIVVSGTTGESPTLEDDEKLALIDFVVKRANGRCKVIAGTGSNHTDHVMHLTREAEKLGVDGFLLVAPYYNRPTQAGIKAHFEAVAAVTSLPIMLYNIPKRTGVNMDANTTLELARTVKNIVAIKESNDMEQITTIIANAPEGFLVYSGDDSTALPLMACGGHGVISVASHVIGKPIKEMIHAFLAGDNKKAAQIHQKYMPIFTGLFVCPNPVPVKYALNYKGLDVGGVRLPLVEATESEKEKIRRLFD
jgi:4-hydroxy-tetrahydrodipicolinate synthase